MCGIFFTNVFLSEDKIEDIVNILKLRGPDQTSILNKNEFIFIHTLLSMTGKYTLQPILKDDVYLLFNGEIYNYEKYESDGEYLLNAYLKYNKDNNLKVDYNFLNELDGEYGIIICDFRKKRIIACSDIFGTKPIWIGLSENKMAISSYKSCLEKCKMRNYEQITANRVITLDFNCNILEDVNYHNFDLNQYKNNYDDFNKSLEESILKRTSNLKHKLFIGLSSGYDSGTISCILNGLNIKHTAYSIIGNDDIEILEKRHNLLKNNKNEGILINLSKSDFLREKENLSKICEDYHLKIDNDEHNSFINSMKRNKDDKKFFNMCKNNKKTLLSADNGSVGLSYISRMASKNKNLVYLSGSGADEIFSDYGFNGVKNNRHSTIAGHYPSDLKKVFPWRNFYNNTQRAYLMKEEYVTGCYGVEGRYPFLDKKVVQEFLWLNNGLKNKNYKSVLHNYMSSFNYPFSECVKIGFNCGIKKHNNGKIDDKENLKVNGRENLRVTDKSKESGLIINMNNLKWTKCYEHVEYFDKTLIGKIKDKIYYYNLKYVEKFGGKLSKCELFENMVKLKNAPKILNDKGWYNHFSSSLIYFSTTDGSDPKYNEYYYYLVF